MDEVQAALAEIRLYNHGKAAKVLEDAIVKATSCGKSWQDHAVAVGKQRDELVAALKDAREEIEAWAAYAGTYFQEKHDLAGVLAEFDAILAKMEKTDD
jgi:hypothetical protein